MASPGGCIRTVGPSELSIQTRPPFNFEGISFGIDGRRSIEGDQAFTVVFCSLNFEHGFWNLVEQFNRDSVLGWWVDVVKGINHNIERRRNAFIHREIHPQLVGARSGFFFIKNVRASQPTYQRVVLEIISA